MCENVNLKCSCMTGYDKGAIKKTLENNIFTIFGNITQNNYIVIRYHGMLTENNEDNYYSLSYFFDNCEDKKNTIQLSKCNNCQGDCYCGVIDLKCHSKLSFSFSDKNNNLELNCNSPFTLNISEDPLDLIMKRYGFKENKNLPTIKEPKFSIIHNIKNIFESIKNFFNTVIQN